MCSPEGICGHDMYIYIYDVCKGWVPKWSLNVRFKSVLSDLNFLHPLSCISCGRFFPILLSHTDVLISVATIEKWYINNISKENLLFRIWYTYSEI